jgi:hypothetical protein
MRRSVLFCGEKSILDALQEANSSSSRPELLHGAVRAMKTFLRSHVRLLDDPSTEDWISQKGRRDFDTPVWVPGRRLPW